MCFVRSQQIRRMHTLSWENMSKRKERLCSFILILAINEWKCHWLWLHNRITVRSCPPPKSKNIVAADNAQINDYSVLSAGSLAPSLDASCIRSFHFDFVAHARVLNGFLFMFIHHSIFTWVDSSLLVFFLINCIATERQKNNQWQYVPIITLINSVCFLGSVLARSLSLSLSLECALRID